MSLDYIMHFGGSGYLPELSVSDEPRAGRSQRVRDAAVVQRTAYAVFPVRSARKTLIESILALV